MGVLIMLILLFGCVILGVPIAFSLGAAGVGYLAMDKANFLITLPQRMWSGSNSFVMIALPLFILAGELMNRGGITKRIIDFSLYLVRPIRGGIGEVNVVASMIFGGISGSSVADTSAIGSVLIPQMVKKGYSKRFSAGVTVASSTMGMIIPPSIPMLLYASISEESVGKLFLAGLIPGVLIGLSQILIVWIISRRRGYHPKYTKFDIKDFLRTFKDGILAIFMPLVIVVCVSFGIATATESAGIAVLYSLILGFFVYKELKVKDLFGILKNTVISTSTIMIILGFAKVFTWILAILQIPDMLGDFILNLDIHKFWIFLMLDIFILLIGTFIDVAPAMLLLVPVLLPIMNNMGVNGIQLGAIVIVGLAVSLVTPPVGMCLNACTRICKEPLGEIFKGALPFLVCNVIILLLVTFVPGISLWLPRILMN